MTDQLPVRFTLIKFNFHKYKYLIQAKFDFITASLCITGHAKLRCYFCFKVCNNTEHLFEHYRAHHKQAGRDACLLCPYCDQVKLVKLSHWFNDLHKYISKVLSIFLLFFVCRQFHSSQSPPMSSAYTCMIQLSLKPQQMTLHQQHPIPIPQMWPQPLLEKILRHHRRYRHLPQRLHPSCASHLPKVVGLCAP